VHYSYYYRPYDVYLGPSYWLTDHLLGEALNARYQDAQYRASLAANDAVARANRAAANAEQAALDASRVVNEADARLNAQARVPVATAAVASPVATGVSSQPAVLTSAIKDEIRAQVEDAVRAHERKEPQALADVLKRPNHLFVVSDDISTINKDSGVACSLTGGDIIRLVEVNAEVGLATLQVVTAKKDSCPAGAKVEISLADLQEFQNQFNETLEEGMEKMKAEVADKQK